MFQSNVQILHAGFDRILWLTHVNEMSSESSEIARPQVSGKINLLK